MGRTDQEARLSGALRVRLDTLLVERALAPTRARARAYIMEGAVFVNGTRVDKAGQAVPRDADVRVTARQSRYVSRGGVKLEAALMRFAIRADGIVAADIGSSTGGFTDCWLQHGASRVYAVDVGYGQLATRLRDDPRVEAHERINARYLEPGLFAGPVPSAASMDVSFIDPRLILPALDRMMAPGWFLIELVKPQFVLGPERVGKGGIVNAPEDHALALQQAIGDASALGLAAVGLMPSPIRGQKGNREFLLYAVKGGVPASLSVEAVVQEAWEDSVP